MADLSDLPTELRRVIEDANGRIDQLSAQMEAGSISIDQWESQMETILSETFEDAARAGADSPDVEALNDSLENFVAIQLAFLANFAADIAANGWQPAYRSRAQMYGEAIKQSYWVADVYKRAGNRVLPLPAMPAEGTQCLSHCGCKWRVVTVNAENNDYDAYWERLKTDSCQTCVEREAQWNPVRIRGGVLL